MESIKDYSHYVDLMRNGFFDKLFFVDKVFDDWEYFVDFGCADGFLTKMVAEIFPKKTVIGLDDNEKFVEVALHKGPSPDNARFNVYDVDKGIAGVVPVPSKSILNLSSVIHEIYAYKTTAEIDRFWKMVFKSGFKKIVIRDMVYDDSRTEIISSQQLARIIKNTAMFDCVKKSIISRFEEIWGPLETPRALSHYLCKYMYADSPNWDRELMENYTGCSVSELMSRIPLSSGYHEIYKEVYTIPYLKRQWHRDLGIPYGTPVPKTHIKLILEK